MTLLQRLLGGRPPGNSGPITPPDVHYVTGRPLREVPDHHELTYFGMGCFWGAERAFWRLGDGVFSTAVGYCGGDVANPTYEEVCTGRSGHAEVVRVVYDPTRIGLDALLKVFFEAHDPTQGNRQGNDIGPQYRSAIFATTPAQLERAQAVAARLEPQLRSAGFGPVTTQIVMAEEFYWAEEYHQQYLAKNPGGYCGLRGTGVSCPIEREST